MNKTQFFSRSRRWIVPATGFAGMVALLAHATPFSVKFMDTSVDPAEDFYHYCAGTWVANTEIPADKSRWGAFDEIGQDNMERVKGILESAAANPGEKGSTLQKVGDFYASGMDVEALEAAGIKPLQPELDRIAAIADVDGLIDEVSHAHLHVGSPLLGFYVSPDSKDSDRYILTMSQGGLSLPSRDYYFDERFAGYRDSFKVHVAKMLELAGASAGDAAGMAETVLAVETALAEVSRTPEALRDPVANYNKLTVAEAAERFTGFPLQRLLANIDYPEGHENIVVGQPEFYEGLAKMLHERPLDDWKTYLRWRALRSSARYLSSAFEEESFRFFGTELNGVPEMEPRWRRVANEMDDMVGFAVGQLYTEQYFPPEVKAELNAMCELMKEVMHDRILRLDWMSAETKQRALEKLASFKVLVGYPDEWRDYSALQVSRGSYYKNVLAAMEVESHRQLDRIGKEVDKDEFHLTPQTVNAYIDPTANRLVFLAGILQPPYFDPKMDIAINWGAIGAIIGHEMTHAFDDKGRMFDADGNLNDWWTEEDAKNFEARAAKLVDQFAAYEPVAGHNINGNLTLGENIADLGGVCIAWEAFHRALKDKPQPEKIDGFTPEQRFFIAWAQNWRTKNREAALIRRLATDPHSPGDYRAFGPLVNLPEFYEAFGIEEGDPMWKPAADRVNIW